MRIYHFSVFCIFTCCLAYGQTGINPVQETIREQQRHDSLSYMSARKKAEALRRHAMLQHKKSGKSGESRAVKPLNQVAPESVPE